MKRFKSILLLHFIILLYSGVSICLKLASAHEFLSLNWCLLYGAVVFILGIYALLWQQVLKHLPLNFAYANKAVTVAWGMLFGILFFKETVEIKHIIGAAIVLMGVVVMVTAGTDKSEKPKASIKEDCGDE